MSFAWVTDRDPVRPYPGRSSGSMPIVDRQARPTCRDMCLSTYTSVATIVYGDFEWDDAKAATNLTKHGSRSRRPSPLSSIPTPVFLADDSGSEQRLVAIGST